MDFQGPLYDVRMSRGQGYNSYIQEPRLYEAVKITPSGSRVVSGTETKRVRSNEGHPSKSQRADPADKDSEDSPTLTGADYIRLLVDGLNDKSSSAPKGDGVKKLPYLEPKRSAISNQTVLFSSKQVKNAKEISDAMGLKTSAAVKAAAIGPGAELGSNISTADDFKDDAVNFLVTVKVVNEKPDRSEDWEFRQVKRLKTRLSNAVCEDCKSHPASKTTHNNHAAKETTRDSHVAKKEAIHNRPDPQLLSIDSDAEERVVIDREIAKSPCQDCGHQRAVEFTRIYGDTFISDFVEGGEIYALINIRSSSKKKLNDLKAYASAQLTPPAVPIQAKVDSSLTKANRDEWDQAETSIRVQWRGGGEIKTHNVQWSLESLIEIANAFPTFVATTSAKIRAVLTPYTALESFQRLQNIFPEHPLTLNYDRCSLFVNTLYEDYKAFHDMWEDINSAILSPDDYKQREVAQYKELARRKKEPTQLGAVDQSDRGSSYSSSSLVSEHQRVDAGGILSKLVHKTQKNKHNAPKKGAVARTAQQTPSRTDLGQAQEANSVNAITRARTLPKSTFRSDFAQHQEAASVNTATYNQPDDPSHHSPQELAKGALRAKQNGLHPNHHQKPFLTADAPGNSSTGAYASVEQVIGASQGQTSLSGTDPASVLLRNVGDILNMKDTEDLKLNTVHPSETRKLSKLRLICRFAMLHIQDVAANLVIDPQNTGVALRGHGSGMPMFSQPSYPYPATIRSILPVYIGRSKPDYSAWHYTSVEDLRFPDFMKPYPGSPYPDEYTYAWDVFGDALSDYKKYEHFQIGNFNPRNEEPPQAMALQANDSRIAGYLDEKSRNDAHMISGIALTYSGDGVPSLAYRNLENQELDQLTGKKPKRGQANTGQAYTSCGGKGPEKPEQWFTFNLTSDNAPFNRFNIYHKQGSGRVAGLEVYRDDEDGDGEMRFRAASEQQQKALLGHLEWKYKTKKPSPMPSSYYSTPGDGFSAQKLWMFAGFVGAFEKIGPLGKGRALAKLAIVWKRRESKTTSGDV